MGHTLSTKANSHVPAKIIEGSLRSDFGALSLRHLREALDIYRSTLSSPRLKRQEFDQVFGVMLGDADTHFELFSGRAELMATGGEDIASAIKDVDALTVFLTLTMLVPAPLLTQLSFIYELVTGSQAADAGLDARQVSRVFTNGVHGLCSLLGARSPERSVFEKTAVYLVQDADDRSASPLVKRRHLLSYLEADMMIMKFLHHAAEKVVGTGLDNASVAGNFRDAALFAAENSENAQTIENDLNDSNDLCKKRLKSLSRTSWWESSSTRIIMEHDWSCGLVLVSLRNVPHAGVARCDDLPTTSPTLPNTQPIEEDNVRTHDNDDHHHTIDIEHLGCAYVDCVGAVDHMMMMESFFDYFKSEASKYAKERIACASDDAMPRFTVTKETETEEDITDEASKKENKKESKKNSQEQSEKKTMGTTTMTTTTTTTASATSSKRKVEKKKKRKDKSSNGNGGGSGDGSGGSGGSGGSSREPEYRSLSEFVSKCGQSWSNSRLCDRCKFWHNIEGKSEEEVKTTEVTMEFGQAIEKKVPTTHRIRRLRAYYHLYMEQPLLHAYEAMIDSPHDDVTMDVDQHADTGDTAIAGVSWWHAAHDNEKQLPRHKYSTRERLVLLGHHCDDIVHIMSDIDLLLVLVENERQWLDGCRYSTLKELGYAMLSTSPLSVVDHNMTALDAFQRVLQRRRSVAVVNTEGKFIYALSEYDFLYLLDPTGVGDLDFAELLRPLKECSLLPDPNQVCHGDDTLVSVVDTMVRCSKNRDLILCTDEGAPISMVSPSDIFELVVRIAEQHVYVYRDSDTMREAEEKRVTGEEEKKKNVGKKKKKRKKLML